MIKTDPNDLSPKESAALKAALCYIDRQARREHPSGRFDNAKRWYPDASEKSPSVIAAREPSRAFPNSYNTAARSLKHCAWLHGADETITRDVVALLREKPTKAGLKRLGKSADPIIMAIDDVPTRERIGNKMTDVMASM
jgi:hypothetical protein